MIQFFRNGRYISSPSIRQRISRLEGASMRTNRPFNVMDAQFNQATPREYLDNASQEELDSLYDYMYNVGNNAYKSRVVPALQNLINNKGDINTVANSMRAAADSKYRGLANRRQWERNQLIQFYNNRMARQKIEQQPTITNNEEQPDATYVQKLIIE